MIHKKTFVNAELDANYRLLYAHNLNTVDLSNPSWKDENGIYRMTGDLFQVVDANNVILHCNEPVSGTQTLYFEYNEAGVSTSGRRLFELPTSTDPGETLRLALGKASTPASNITLTAFLAWLFNKLGFLKVTSNLSDLANVATARANLSVYSQAQADAALASKATLYQSGSGAVLGTGNTSIYNPVGNYNPATMRNVKNLGWSMILAAYVSSSGSSSNEHFKNSDLITSALSVERTATGRYTITHNLGNTNYFVLGETLGSTALNVGIGKITKAADSFVINMGDDGGLQDSDFNFFMFLLNTYTADE